MQTNGQQVVQWGVALLGAAGLVALAITVGVP
jgi:hypothetical protein